MRCELCGLECRQASQLRDKLVCTNCVSNLAEWALYEQPDVPAARAWAITETDREARRSGIRNVR